MSTSWSLKRIRDALNRSRAECSGGMTGNVSRVPPLPLPKVVHCLVRRHVDRRLNANAWASSRQANGCILDTIIQGNHGRGCDAGQRIMSQISFCQLQHAPGRASSKIWKIKCRACFLQRNFLFGQRISSHLSSRLGAITVPWMQSWFSMIMSENSFVFCIITFDLLE